MNPSGAAQQQSLALNLPRAFYRTAAIASVASAATTLAIILLPQWIAQGTGLEARMARVTDPAYLLRAWTYLVHPVLAGLAALALGLRLRHHAPACALLGTGAFCLWAVVEFCQQALTLFAFDRWRSAWLAGDAAVRESIAVRAAIYDGLWDAAYVVILIAFLAGCGLLAAGLLRLAGLSRLVGALYAAAAVLTLCLLVSELGGPSLPAGVVFWGYIGTQPLARVLIGVWLWRSADEDVRVQMSQQARQ